MAAMFVLSKELLLSPVRRLLWAVALACLALHAAARRAMAMSDEAPLPALHAAAALAPAGDHPVARAVESQRGSQHRHVRVAPATA